MIKFKPILIVFAALLIAAETYIIFTQKHQNKVLSESVISLNEAVKELTNVKTYQISLNPEITTKNTATFGKVSQVYLQYYFKLDGEIRALQPDSVIEITKTISK